MFDLLIRGARLLDGTGAEVTAGNGAVAIEGDTIAAVGALEGAAARETLTVPADQVLCPGFIDAHSHSDAYLLIEPSALSKITQGFTTEVCGNCGGSAAPIRGPRDLPSDWAAQEYPGLWTDLASYRALLADVHPAVNTVMLTGHNTLRRQVVGYADRPATEEELRRMERLLEESLDAGSRGLSTGLIYAPGRFAPFDELQRLAAVAARHGGLYASHMRSEGERLLEGIREALALGERAGMPVQISHLKTSGRANWGKLDEALALLNDARARGVRVAADRYPYTYGATELDVVFPAWASEGGREAILARLEDAALRARLRGELAASRAVTEWQGVLVGATRHPDNTRFRGLPLPEVSRLLDLPHPVDAILHLCRTDRLTTGAFFGGMHEANMRRVLAEPWVMLGTDASLRAPYGPLADDYPHPRAYGAAPRFIRLALDEGLVSLPEAVRKLTALPAAQFGLDDRGILAAGKKADCVVFDPGTFADHATYGDPHRLSTGIRHLVVNGTVTIRDGQPTGERAGRFL